MSQLYRGHVTIAMVNVKSITFCKYSPTLVYMGLDWLPPSGSDGLRHKEVSVNNAVHLIINDSSKQQFKLFMLYFYFIFSTLLRKCNEKLIKSFFII